MVHTRLTHGRGGVVYGRPVALQAAEGQKSNLQFDVGERALPGQRDHRKASTHLLDLLAQGLEQPIDDELRCRATEAAVSRQDRAPVAEAERAQELEDVLRCQHGQKERRRTSA